MAKKPYAIGTTAENLVYLFDMGIRGVLQTFKPYSIVVENAAGGAVGQGWAQDDWEFTVITDAQRAALRAYCPGASSDVYVKTYDDSLATPAWKVYRSKMRWNQIEEDRQNDKRIKLAINFKLIEDVTPE